jgi:HlyD family secretion protein
VGNIRPSSERTEVHAIVGGIIDSIFYREGDVIQKGQLLLRVKDNVSAGKRMLNGFETQQRNAFIYDLQLLTAADSLQESILQRLQSPLYREQASRFLHKRAELLAQVNKADKELEMNTGLAKEKVISPKEFYDYQNQSERLHATFKALQREQLANWQQDLAKFRQELAQYELELTQVNTDAKYYEVKAPVSGVIQGLNTKYSGGALQANETVCTISPEANMIAECYVNTQDVGLLKCGQEARFQVDAFNYNYFGILTGKILSIDNDYTIVDNKPIFKVRCAFDSTQVHLKNGFSGQLKKGLTFQVRFIIGERTLWQLLFDKADDWFNPTSPLKQ